MLKDAQSYSRIFGITQEDLSNGVAAKQLISFYVAQYYEYEAGLLPDDAWEAIKGEICTLICSKSYVRLESQSNQMVCALGFALQNLHQGQSRLRTAGGCPHVPTFRTILNRLSGDPIEARTEFEAHEKARALLREGRGEALPRATLIGPALTPHPISPCRQRPPRT